MNGAKVLRLRQAVVCDDLRGAVERHAAASYPHECCGALLVRDGELVGALPLRNAARDPHRHYAIPPGDYRAAEARAARRGADIGGFYHSHPDTPPDPSRTDVALAWPNLLYVTVAVHRAVVTGWTIWEIDAQSA